jgi:hypothetical protein
VLRLRPVTEAPQIDNLLDARVPRPLREVLGGAEVLALVVAAVAAAHRVDQVEGGAVLAWQRGQRVGPEHVGPADRDAVGRRQAIRGARGTLDVDPDPGELRQQPATDVPRRTGDEHRGHRRGCRQVAIDSR